MKATLDFGLHYTFETNVNLAGYCDADWSGCLDDRRSTSGGCFYLGNNMVSWHSKKQNCVSFDSLGRVHCIGKLLYSVTVDASNACGLWYHL